MRRPAVFFDRDNTLIACNGYLGDPDKVVLVEGAADAIARCRSLGYAVVVFSNQSGVARGMFDEEAVHAVNARLDEILAEANRGAIIDRHEFCPFHPDGIVDQYRKDSPLRKPRPGMILQAAERLALDLSRSWAIGDAPRDIEAGKAAGCRTILFHHPGLEPSAAQSAESKILPDHFVESLQAAVNIIEAAANTPEAVEPDLPLPVAPPVQQSASKLPATPVDLSKVEELLGQILTELQAPAEPHAPRSFSITKLFAGIVQMASLTSFLFAFKNGSVNEIAIAIMLQLFTIALLIMDHQE